MGFEKSEIKRLTVQDVGLKIAKRQEAAKHEIIRMEGGVAALRESVVNFDSVKAHWKAKLDIDDAEITQETVKDVIKAIDMCKMSFSGFADKLQATKVAKGGEVYAYDKALDITEAIFKEEGRKTAALTEPEVEIPEDKTGKPRPKFRAVGQKPDQSIASQRRSEPEKEVKKTKAKKANGKSSVAFSGVVPKSANRVK